MRNGGLPKQFLKLLGKPIVIYTLEKFEQCEEIDKVLIVCHGGYIEHMQDLLKLYQIKKVEQIIVGGNDRQNSIQRGLDAIMEKKGEPEDDDIVVIHDAVRPLVELMTIRENIRIARQYGCAITVHPVTESVVITKMEEVELSDFKKRADTYSMTAPQTFRLCEIVAAYRKAISNTDDDNLPLLDAAMVYSWTGGEIHMVKEPGSNIKITTPEDFYLLKAILELEENKCIFGL